MEKKKIKCPQCHGLLEVTNPGDRPSMLITCQNPQCGARMRIDFQTGNTQLDDGGKDSSVIGHIVYAGDRYSLNEGVNTIGRRAPTSEATLQIDTTDQSMSRLHACLRVERLKSGRVKAILSDARPPEKAALLPIRFDDDPLFPEDAIVLANGDTFILGQTKLTYRK